MITAFPIAQKNANAMVSKWHSHHKPVVGMKFGIGAKVDELEVGCVIVGRPVAQALDDGCTWEVTRLCCRGGDKNTASFLLARAWDASEAMGVRCLVSYTRKDEDGTCYKAAGWAPVAEVLGRGWTGGNKATRWLPGFYEPSTEIVDRVRWERRPYEAVRAVVRCVTAMGRLAERERLAA